MPKTPLKPSPIQLLSQDFDEINVQSQHDSEGGSNTLEVSPTLIPVKEHPDTWLLMLSVEIGSEPDSKKPPYLASVRASGYYRVEKSYQGDPQRLVRITGASMLYGAVREMLCSITSRCDNGMLTLPSISFFEEAPKTKTAKKAAKKTAKKTSSKKAR
jgi:preprotein translocase subunit SecB